MSHANGGMAFEMLLNLVNQLLCYEKSSANQQTTLLQLGTEKQRHKGDTRLL
ncbi:hypothetical protein [Fictibacillus solisalsi]|uniref:hypothetical protein n=1 Tax=Fictibacillus solisalsi TaxID=459525 RepID=UPI001FCDFC1E|nr:hypothetical protein [Fictibacillus solisalsi]